MTEQDLYRELDAITGGLESFLAESADETWRQEGYSLFTLTASPPNRLLFGFRTAYGMDSAAPDPIVQVKIDRERQAAKIVLIDTLMGYRQETDGDLAYCVVLLEEMQRRRLAGGVAVERAGCPAQ